MTPSDLELLQRFARDHAQDAFTELVQRHVNLVYSAALRQVRSPQLAEEVAQSVFTDLARVAATPSSPWSGRDASLQPSLTPWLYTVTRHTAVDVIRKESRRQLREQLAIEMNAMNAPDASWNDIEPLLDEAVAALDDADRAAVLLRYFENQSLRDVGAQLGVSDDAAQKRVSRAVERLREFFAKRGVTVGAGGLVVVISANAVQAAPVGLAVTISAAALAGTAATTSTLIAATTKTIAMTTLQKTLVTATVAVLAGVGIYEAKQACDARSEVQTIQQQQAPLAEQVRQLQNSLAIATNRMADLLAENSRLKSNPERNELLKLRGEVTRLRPLQADVIALQKMVNQSSSGLPEWTTNSVANVGRANPIDALETYISQSRNANLDEIKDGIVGDNIDPPSQDALQNFVNDRNNHPLANDGIVGYKILSQAWIASDKVQLELQAKLDNGGMGISVPLTLREINGEWKLVVFNVYDSDGKVNRLSFANESPVR